MTAETSNIPSEIQEEVKESDFSLENFVFEKILSNSENRKVIFILGK